MSKTKYKLIKRKGYNPVATTDEVIAAIKASESILQGQIYSAKAITVAEIKKNGYRIYTTQEHLAFVENNKQREANIAWAKGVKTGVVLWFNKNSGVGMVRTNDRTIELYACNIKGKKTWYPETACVYYTEGQTIDCHLDHGLLVGDTQGYFDEEGWARLDHDHLAFKCNEKGEAINGLFSERKEA